MLINTMILLLFSLKIALYVKDFQAMYHDQDNYRAFVFITANMICYYVQILVTIICVIKVKEYTIEKYALINEYCFCTCMVFVVGIAIWVMNSK